MRATVSTPRPSIISSDKSKFSAPTKASVASKQGCSHRIVWRPNNTLARRQWSWESHCQYHSDLHLIYEELDTVHQARPRRTEKAGKRKWSEMRKFSVARRASVHMNLTLPQVPSPGLFPSAVPKAAQQLPFPTSPRNQDFSHAFLLLVLRLQKL